MRDLARPAHGQSMDLLTHIARSVASLILRPSAGAVVFVALVLVAPVNAATATDPADASGSKSGRVVTLSETSSGPSIDVHHVPASDSTRVAAELETSPEVLEAEVDRRVAIATEDPEAWRQWGHLSTETPAAWKRNATGSGVVVAVLDTGVDASHPDLAGRVLPGADFVYNTGDARTDPNGHGTAVAGVIAAVADNGLGIAGVAHQASILPVRVLADDGRGWDSDVTEGILWAADAGADIINLSLGASNGGSSIQQEAIRYATDKGILVVAAAGNEDTALGSHPAPFYPAAFPETFAVGATTFRNERAAFSNRGSYVNVSAPGEEILTTFPGGRYSTISGTSFAAPHVAAVATQLRSLPGTNLTPAALRTLIETTAHDLGPRGRDASFGFGMVNSRVAVCKASGTCPATPRTSFTTYHTPKHAVSPAKVGAQATFTTCAGWLGAYVLPSKVTFTVTTAAGRPVTRQSVTPDGASCASVSFPVHESTRVTATNPLDGSSVTSRVYRVRPKVRLAKKPGRKLVTTTNSAISQPLRLQQKVNGKWVTRAKSSLSPINKRRVFTVKPGTYRVVLAKTPRSLGATSPTVRVRHAD